MKSGKPFAIVCFLVRGIIFASIIFYAAGSPAQDGALEQQYADAQRALSEGKYAEAERGFDKLRKLNPNIGEIHANLGLIYFQQERFDDAVPELQLALKLKPSLTNSAYILGMSFSELGRYSEALPGLEQGFRSKDKEMRRMCGLQLERAYTGLRRDDKAV